MKSDSRRRSILDSASRIIARLGYERTTMDMIAKESHYSKKAVYKLFGSKEDLFLDLASDLLEQLVPQDMLDCAAEGSGAERVERIALAMTRCALERPRSSALVSRAINLRRVLLGRSGDCTAGAACRERFDAHMARLRDLLERSIADGIADGSFRPDLSKEEALFTVLFFIRGLLDTAALGSRGIVGDGGGKRADFNAYALELILEGMRRGR